MLCQKCGLQESAVHLESIVFGQKIEEHLCALCAGARKPEEGNLAAVVGLEKPAAGKIKEIEFTPRIVAQDYQTKLRHAEEFLGRDIKVRLRLKFRGREMAHPEIGLGVIKRAVADLAGVSRPDGGPKLIGRNIYVMLTPVPANKRKSKFDPEAGR
jgi:hypothetical protein